MNLPTSPISVDRGSWAGVAKLLELADGDVIRLPEEIVAEAEALARVQVWREQLQPPPETLELISELAELLLQAATDAKKQPATKDAILEHNQARTVYEQQVAALDEALDSGARTLMSTVQQRLEEILTAYLRPVLDSTVAAVQKAAAELEGFEPDPLLLLSAPDNQRKAYGKLQELARAYGRVHEARAILTRLGLAPQFDAADHFAEFKNGRQLWPSRGMGTESRPPWPLDDPVGRLLWIVSGDPQPWLPTAEEQDARAREWADENRQRNAGALTGVERG